jgi:outer membrane protein OmpA-like peptidoglycan-associated protein
VIIFGLVVLMVLIPILTDDRSPTGTDGAGGAQPFESTGPLPPREPLDAGTTVSPTTPPTSVPSTPLTAAEATPAGGPETTSPAPTIDASPPVTTAAPAPSTTVATTPPPASTDLSYRTLPDGSPEPILAIFDVETITLAGSVPSSEAAETLRALAIANSDFPDAEIVDRLVVNADVPTGIGVRVIELTSARFPDGTADIVAEHAAQLDRVATVMKALGNVTVMVVGHADQRGDADANYVLSEDRAVAVVRYLVEQGIEPSRLAARAVGEDELLTLEQNEEALELNRRTEFIFYGLLAS